jgi:hypothetical protein
MYCFVIVVLLFKLPVSSGRIACHISFDVLLSLVSKKQQFDVASVLQLEITMSPSGTVSQPPQSETHSVTPLHVLPRCTAGEDHHEVLARRYGIPTASTRDTLYDTSACTALLYCPNVLQAKITMRY